MTNEVIAYFSMESLLEPGIPTYSGGLGVLAGDTRLGRKSPAEPQQTVNKRRRIDSRRTIRWGVGS